jgi:hypothetical protein
MTEAGIDEVSAERRQDPLASSHRGYSRIRPLLEARPVKTNV